MPRPRKRRLAAAVRLQVALHLTDEGDGVPGVRAAIECDPLRPVRVRHPTGDFHGLRLLLDEADLGKHMSIGRGLAETRPTLRPGFLLTLRGGSSSSDISRTSGIAQPQGRRSSRGSHSSIALSSG